MIIDSVKRKAGFRQTDAGSATSILMIDYFGFPPARE